MQWVVTISVPSELKHNNGSESRRVRDKFLVIYFVLRANMCKLLRRYYSQY